MKWALVLSGGGAKGIPYIGMLQALEELEVPQPNLIVGCSIGAIVGCLYSIGYKADDLKHFLLTDFDPAQYYGLDHITSIKAINKVFSIGSAVSNLVSGTAIDNGSRFYALLQKLTAGKSFIETNIPFICNAMDLKTGKEVVLSSGELAKAVLSSSSYPIALPPCRYENMLLIDGSMLHNTPIWIAKKMGYENIFGVTLSGFTETDKQPASVLDVISRALVCICENKQLTKEDYPDFWLDLAVTFDSTDFSNISGKIKHGYEKTMEQSEQIKKFFASGISGHFNRRKIRSAVSKNYGKDTKELPLQYLKPGAP